MRSPYFKMVIADRIAHFCPVNYTSPRHVRCYASVCVVLGWSQPNCTLLCPGWSRWWQMPITKDNFQKY